MIRRVLLALALLLAPLHETAEAQQSAAARRCAIYLCGGNRPVLDLNFATMSAFPSSPAVTFSRSTTATGANNAGVLATASSGVPRFVYDPSTLVPLGYLSEAQATNIQLHSQFDSGWSVTGGTLTASNVTSPDGTVDGATFTEDVSTGLHAPNITATTAITANTIYTGSMWLKAGTRTNAVLSWENAGPTDAVRVNVDLNACTVSAGSVVGTGVISGTPASQQWPNGWCRVFIAGTINAASVQAFLVPYGANPAGTVSYTGTSATFQVFGADIKLGVSYSGYIATTTANVTRAGDVATVALSSTSIPAAPSALTIISKFMSPPALDTSKAYYPAEIDDGTGNNRILLRFNSAANSPFQVITVVTAVQQIGVTAYAVPPASTVMRFWAAISPGNSATQIIGQTKLTSAVATPFPSGLATLRLGSQVNAQQLGGPIARLQIYNTRLPDGRASAIAAGL